jgi:hypothetical protein
MQELSSREQQTSQRYNSRDNPVSKVHSAYLSHAGSNPAVPQLQGVKQQQCNGGFDRRRVQGGCGCDRVSLQVKGDRGYLAATTHRLALSTPADWGHAAC